MKLLVYLIVLLCFFNTNLSAQQEQIMEKKEFELKVEQSITFKGLELRLTGVVFEEILGHPTDLSMPAGAGVVVHLSVKSADGSQEINLNELSSPYKSKSFVTWKNYKISLVEVSGYNSTLVKIGLEIMPEKQ